MQQIIGDPIDWAKQRRAWQVLSRCLVGVILWDSWRHINTTCASSPQWFFFSGRGMWVLAVLIIHSIPVLIKVNGVCAISGILSCYRGDDNGGSGGIIIITRPVDEGRSTIARWTVCGIIDSRKWILGLREIMPECSVMICCIRNAIYILSVIACTV